jgi:hypothetical protein
MENKKRKVSKSRKASNNTNASNIRHASNRRWVRIPRDAVIAGSPAKVIKIKNKWDTSNGGDASKSMNGATVGGRQNSISVSKGRR